MSIYTAEIRIIDETGHVVGIAEQEETQQLLMQDGIVKHEFLLHFTVDESKRKKRGHG